MELAAVLTPAEEGGFVALNPETGTTTQGETVEEAVACGAELVRAMERPGLRKVRQSGSHVIMKREAVGCVVPLHDSVKVGTPAGVLRQASITPEEFMEAFHCWFPAGPGRFAPQEDLGSLYENRIYIVKQYISSS